MTKHLTIIENNHITGVVYGLVEMHDEVEIARKYNDTVKKIKKQNTKQQYNNCKQK